MGWLVPIIIVGKLLIQLLWQNNKKWDDPLNEEETEYGTSL